MSLSQFWDEHGSLIKIGMFSIGLILYLALGHLIFSALNWNETYLLYSLFVLFLVGTMLEEIHRHGRKNFAIAVFFFGIVCLGIYLVRRWLCDIGVTC